MLRKEGNKMEKKKKINNVEFDRNNKVIVLWGFVTATFLVSLIAFFIGLHLGSYEQELFNMHKDLIDSKNLSVCFKSSDNRLDLYYYNGVAQAAYSSQGKEDANYTDNPIVNRSITIITVPIGNPLRKPDVEQQDRIAAMIRASKIITTLPSTTTTIEILVNPNANKYKVVDGRLIRV